MEIILEVNRKIEMEAMYVHFIVREAQTFSTYLIQLTEQVHSFPR